ncbi:hypothetical protein [Vreelandella massiliensis]|uniref:hypothetical protein n=1 Tax=Vreelandella massiliensis TaxID=1816686 RepID=UPI00096A4D49|nr:hypothetical protein [Halomonas massiliensis]
MIDELSRSIRAHLYERVTNPLLGAVTVAWVFWNYKLILILFASSPPADKIAFIENVLYPNWYLSVIYFVFLPMVSGMAFLYAYPFPAKYVYRYTRNQLKELKKIKLEVEDETPASKEEHIQLKRKVNELETRYYVDLTERDTEIARLQELLANGKRSDLKPSPPRPRNEAESGAGKEIISKAEHQQLNDDGKISHKKIVGLNVGGRDYVLGKDFNKEEPGEVNVFELSDSYNYEEEILVRVQLSDPLEPNQVVWVFDGYSHRQLEGVEFKLQKADFEMKSARIAIHQPNPLKPGKDVVVSNIVQFQY